MRFLFIILVSIAAMFPGYELKAQKLSDEWRLVRKVRTDPNGQKLAFEYSYTGEGKIESVNYLSLSGAANITISDFQYAGNGLPTAYKVIWNRESGYANVTLSYDRQGRITELKKVNDNRETTTFSYRYSQDKIFVTQKKSNLRTQGTVRDNKISFYNEQGNYSETSSDAATQTIETIITVKQNDRRNEPNPDNFTGGFVSPEFLGVIAFGSEPEITSTKNEVGLISSLSYSARNSNRTYEYTYEKFKKSAPVVTPVDEGAGTVIKTNINCVAGKQQVERILKAQEGVFSVKTDIRTGKLTISYSSDGTPYTEIIRLINEAGFEADNNKASPRSTNPCLKSADTSVPYVRKKGLNIFDAKKDFAKAPIKFIPFKVTPDAAAKGFKTDSIYSWVAPDGKQKVASGAEILKQVNEMEAELNLRGRTLRKRNAFSALSYKLVNPNALLKLPPAALKNVKTNTLNNGLGNQLNKFPVISTKHRKLPDISSALATTISGDVGIYFGRVTAQSGEFQGLLSTTTILDNNKCKTQCPFDLTVSLDAKQIQSLNISKCILEISANPDRKPNDADNVLATADFNFKSPAKTKYGIENVNINGDAPPSFHTLFYFPVKLKDLSKLSQPKIAPELLYAYVKFYNDKGQILYYSSYNTAVIEHKIEVPIFIADNKNVSAKFDDAFTDPTGLFGMYYKSNNINAAYSKTRDEATLLVTEKSNLSGDVEVGARFYNFLYLLDNSLPKYFEKPFINSTFSSDYSKRYNEMVPPIRIPGSKISNDMNNYPGYEVNYSLYNGEEKQGYNKASAYTETKSVQYNIFDQRFFIGPVPCRVKVDVTGNSRMRRTATMDTLSRGTVSLSTAVTPHLDLTLSGEGGVDAAIAYAKIVANVKVIEVDLPITTKAAKDADLQADLKISALSGEIYFTAGLCIPIPWFDDICTDFRIDIFSWTGPSKTYPLVK